MDLLMPEHGYLVNIAVMGGLCLIVLLPWVLALIDVLSNNFRGDQKAIWVIVLLTTGIFGVIIYLLIGRQQKITRHEITYNK